MIVDSDDGLQEWENPLTDEYKKLKDWVVNSNRMAWFYSRHMTGEIDLIEGKSIPFYGHTVVERPDIDKQKPCSEITSSLFEQTYEVIQQIFNYNNNVLNVIFRINFNCVTPHRIERTGWHEDLKIPHKNFIVYLTKFTDGWTYLKNGDEIEKSEPKEDGIIIFEGEHCHAPPKKEGERRIVLVVCYL